MSAPTENFVVFFSWYTLDIYMVDIWYVEKNMQDTEVFFAYRKVIIIESKKGFEKIIKSVCNMIFNFHRLEYC